MVPLDSSPDEPPLDCLERHCRMYLFASGGSPLMLMDEIAQDFFTFGLLHLTSTMFIVTDERDSPTKGLFHKVLDPLGLSHVLKDVDRVLSRKVGSTSLGKYIQTKRNILATHGTLRFSSQSKAVQDVTMDERALEEYENAMRALDAAVSKLYRELESVQKVSTPPRVKE